LFPKAEVMVVHDGVAALLAGTLGEPGVLLLAGTGSLALALGPDGREIRAGGWGYLLGDEGSGYWIGREAIRAALRAEDGRGPATSLTRRLCRAAGVERVSDLVGPVHRGEWSRARIAGLAKDVLEAAVQGDEVARAIIDSAARELALLVRAVLDRAEFLASLDPVPTVTAGGLFRMGEAWLARVERALAREAPRARLAGRVEEPVVGAAYLALKTFHNRVPEPALERLRALRAASG
ncbi:MAG TPA: BadF/BadG/BcrA/BcrD ATPase family protein, partial [Limnochorda sp.]